jgi:hypothetical protein
MIKAYDSEDLGCTHPGYVALLFPYPRHNQKTNKYLRISPEDPVNHLISLSIVKETKWKPPLILRGIVHFSKAGFTKLVLSLL